jgi:hypothetical protein
MSPEHLARTIAKEVEEAGTLYSEARATTLPGRAVTRLQEILRSFG